MVFYKFSWERKEHSKPYKTSMPGQACFNFCNPFMVIDDSSVHELQPQHPLLITYDQQFQS